MAHKLTFGFAVDDVLRQHGERVHQLFKRGYPEGNVLSDKPDPFSLTSSYEFRTNDTRSPREKEQLFLKFINTDYIVELFGTAGEPYFNAIKEFNDVCKFLTDEGHDVCVVSKEFGLTKPLTLSFLGGKGCLVDTVYFIDNDLDYFNRCDVLVAANYKLFTQKPEGCRVVRMLTPYNERHTAGVDLTINTLAELGSKKVLKELLAAKQSES